MFHKAKVSRVFKFMTSMLYIKEGNLFLEIFN